MVLLRISRIPMVFLAKNGLNTNINHLNIKNIIFECINEFRIKAQQPSWSIDQKQHFLQKWQKTPQFGPFFILKKYGKKMNIRGKILSLCIWFCWALLKNKIMKTNTETSRCGARAQNHFPDYNNAIQATLRNNYPCR